MNHEVVARAHFDRQRRAGHLHAGMQGADAAVERAAPAGHVGQDGGLQFRGAAHDVGADTGEVFDDVLIGHECFLFGVENR
ncbi:hypothetical protein D9M69_592920 [compost metagenome]